MDNLFSLIKELAKVNELHKEYQSKDISFVIDANRIGDVLKFNVEIKENKDKEEFEKWASQLDDEFFGEVWESLAENSDLKSLNDKYESEKYSEVISQFKTKAKELALSKINALNKIVKGI